MNRPPDNQPTEARQDEAGFTLVELIASLVIMAVVMTLLGSSVHTLAASWGRQTDRINANDGIARGLAVFRADVRAMRHLSLGADGAVRPAFIGNRHMMTFLSSASRHPGAHELLVVRYTLERKNRAVQLVRRTGRFRPNTPLDSMTLQRPVVVIDNLATAGLSYQGVDELGAAWARHWADSTALPRLVRLQMTVASQPRVPAIIARPGSEIDQHCIISNASQCAVEHGSEPSQDDQTTSREGAR